MGLPGFIQQAYVTTSLDRAMDDFRGTLRISDYLVMRDHGAATSSGARASMHVGLAWIGNSMIELIEPIGGDDAIYRAPLPATGYATRFHHVARRFESEAAYAAEIAHLRARNVAFPIETVTEKARMCYADLRSELGCYVECLHFTPEGAKWLDSIPRH